MKRHHIYLMVGIALFLPFVTGCSGTEVFFNFAIVLATVFGSYLSIKSYKGAARWNIYDWVSIISFVLASLVVDFAVPWFLDILTNTSWYMIKLNSIIIYLISVVVIVAIALCICLGLVCRHLSKNHHQKNDQKNIEK